MILKIIVAVLFMLPFGALAANPSVQSFTSSAASINSGQVISLSWRMADAGGYTFIVPCAQGIKVKKSDGTAFPCDTKVSSVLTAVDGIDLLLYNVSGNTKNVTLRAIPKDATGTDYNIGRQDLSIPVTTALEPIASFAGATSTASYTSYPITWTSSILDGVNLSISCSQNIRASSTYYAQVYIPCNTPIFTTDLAGSGTLTLFFLNSSPLPENLTLTLLPAMSTGAYDGSHAKTFEVSVRSSILPDPSVLSFNASETTGIIREEIPVTFTWTTEHAPNANLQISCNDNLVANMLAGNATTTLTCGSAVSTTPLPPSGTTKLYFLNKSLISQPISILLLPGRSGGGFDGTRAKTLNFSIAPKGAPTITSLSPNTSSPTALPGRATPPPVSCAGNTLYDATTGARCQKNITISFSSPNKKFLTNLRRGSLHGDVRVLQEFFKTDKTLYPEGVVSGLYGPATERAVGRLQEKYNIAKKGSAGYGALGPKTRTFLNSFIQ